MRAEAGCTQACSRYRPACGRDPNLRLVCAESCCKPRKKNLEIVHLYLFCRSIRQYTQTRHYAKLKMFKNSQVLTGRSRWVDRHFYRIYRFSRSGGHPVQNDRARGHNMYNQPQRELSRLLSCQLSVDQLCSQLCSQ